MLLYLIRHGEPDYVTDTLTEEGWKQARLVSVRLIESGLDEIHSSPMGRARQTAQPTAEKLGLPVIVEPWAYELGAECRTTYPDGKPKLPSTLPPEYLHQPAFRKLDSLEGIRQIPGLNDSQLADRFEMISTGTDAMLEKLGFRRNEDGTYDVIAPSDRHIALFCHAGMMRVILAHLLNLPFQLLEASTMCHYTGITILRFKDGSDITRAVLVCGHRTSLRTEFRSADPLQFQKTILILFPFQFQAEGTVAAGNQADGFLAVIGSGFRMNNSSGTGREELRRSF